MCSLVFSDRQKLFAPPPKLLISAFQSSGTSPCFDIASGVDLPASRGVNAALLNGLHRDVLRSFFCFYIGAT